MIYAEKFKYINELIIFIDIYTSEIERFPKSIIDETNLSIKNFISEIVFAIHDISSIIYLTKNIINKILPHFYKLIINFLKKKSIFLAILKDIEENKEVIEPEDYNYLLGNNNLNEDYEFLISRAFNIFDKDFLYNYTLKNISEIYQKTNITEKINLAKFLDIYDNSNEINFPPFSLLEVKDYEYFYEDEGEDNTDNNIDKHYKIFNSIRENFIAQYKDVTSLAFLGISSGKLTNKKIDYSIKYVNLFKSFINSRESINLVHYRTLLCIMVKLLLYDCEHIQLVFKELCYDKYFFNNLNRELNYHIVQCINISKKYEFFFGCTKITDITKLTIQFLQLLGEGFNTDFHDNILKGIIKIKKIRKKSFENSKENKDINNKEENENENDNESEDNDSINLVINEETIEKAINMTVKNELNKRRVIPLVNTKCTIYETIKYNLRIIYHLMNLNSLVRG